MPVIIPPGFAQAVVVLSLSGDSEPIVNTFGVELSGGDPVDDANAIFTNYNDTFDGVVSDQYTQVAVDLYVGQDGGPNLVYTSTEAPQPMTQSGAPLPQNCAGLVRKRTDLAGRRGRGRFYLPGLSEGDVSAVGIIQSTYLAAIQAAADAFLDGLQTGSTPMVVLHRSEGAGAEPPPTPVVALVVENRIATQRRRLRP